MSEAIKKVAEGAKVAKTCPSDYSAIFNLKTPLLFYKIGVLLIIAFDLIHKIKVPRLEYF